MKNKKNPQEKSCGENELRINESFLGFVELKDQSSKGYESKLMETLDKFQINIKKSRGQGFDGATTMSGEYNGLQKRIKDISPNADYIHCASHNLNLVLNDSVSHIPEISRFFDIVQKVYVFFSESLPRWQDLKETASKDLTTKKLTLKKLCPTRWSSRNDCLLAMKSNFNTVMKCLTEIILHSSKKKEAEEASAIRKNLDKFDFILLLTLESKVLEIVNIASQKLQIKNLDLDKACNYLNLADKAVRKLRDNFAGFLGDAETLATSWKIPCQIPQKRQRVVKIFHDEIASDHRIEDPLKRFEINVFNASLDIIIQQLQRRFTGLHTVNQYFSFLSPKNLQDLSNEEIKKRSESLVDKYSDDLSTNLGDQVISFRTLLSSEISQKKCIREIAGLLIEENSCLSSCLPDLTIALQLFLTLPVTVATAERSFSKLKLIKSYLRSTMSQSRLSDLALLSIENEEARQIDIDSIVDKFLLLKKRRFGQMKA